VTSDASAIGHQQHAAAAAPAGAVPRPSETEQKLEMIGYSYAEVLDATKHQDDKIGQLLTSVAFLTAATLALAALDSGNFIARRFAVEPYKLPLALIALVVFLVGVAWSVMLLLASLSTPLRVPGLTRPKRDNKPMQWVKNVRTSQIYFYEISRVSVSQWEDKWSAPVEDLRQERLRSLIRETHNLGVRTRAKYDRTTEAVGLLSLALLAFALSIVFVAIVAATPSSSEPIALNLWQRLLIGWVIGCYAWLQTLGQIRYNRQAVDEVPDSDIRSLERRKSRAEICYAVAIGLLMIDMLEFDKSWPGLGAWVGFTIFLALCYLSAFLLTSSKEPRTLRQTWTAAKTMMTAAGMAVKAAKTEETGSKTVQLRQWRRDYGGRVLQVVTTGALTIAVIWCGVNSWYAGQLGVVCTALLLLIGSAIMQPTLAARKSRREYYDDLKAAQQSTQPSGN
jgi:hypothetical protein